MSAVAGRQTLIALAPGDPLAAATFSGYSRQLFNGIRARGVTVTALTSRDMRWYDAATGALNLGGFVRGRFTGRRAPKIRPDWYWSRAGFQRFNSRLESRLKALPERSALLQVGTHVRVSLPGTDAYCVTDCTVVQALESGEFSISQTSPRVAKEAVECQREVFASCRKVFTLSQWAANSIINDYGIDPKRVIAIGAGANVTSSTSQREIDRDHPYLLFVGMDWDQKGGPLLLEALKIARATYPNLRLKVVGCSPAVQDPGVDIIGYLPHGDPAARERLAQLYAGASCFTILSPFDCFPNVLLEAQLIGVPVLTLAGQGRPEAIRHRETGYLVEQPTADAVAEGLRFVVGQEWADGRMGLAAQAWARPRFTWPTVVEHVLAEMDVDRQLTSVAS